MKKMAKEKDPPFSVIRQGNAQYDFKDFMERVPEPETPKDRFAQSFLYLGQAVRQAEKKKQQTVSGKSSGEASYPFETAAEQQGIFLIDGQKVDLCGVPFTMIGKPSPNSPYNLLAPYATLLEEFVERSFLQIFDGRVNYYSTVRIFHGKHPEVEVPHATNIILNRMYQACLFQPARGKERILYQVTDGDYRELKGAGFLYRTVERDLCVQEIKRLRSI